MSLLRFRLAGLIVFAALSAFPHRAGGAQAQAVAQTLPDVSKIGPQVGATVPAFSLRDQNGTVRTLNQLMGPKGLMLIFSRSADWCPYCRTQMVEIQGRLADLRKQGLSVAVITYDPIPILKDFASNRGLTYPMLSDPGSTTIKRYGLLNTTVDPTNPEFGYPFPGTFILNPKGVVTSRFFEPAYTERNTVASVLVRLGNMVDVPATKISSPNLDITSYITDTLVTRGTHFSVVLDVTPGPRVHVYAPDVRGYKPIALTIERQPLVVTRDTQFPVPEDYFFAPLNEHVPVYQKPFRIVHDLMIEAGPAGRAFVAGGPRPLTIKGVLSYQACDDKVCFVPQTVPLSWTVMVREVDRTAVVTP